MRKSKSPILAAVHDNAKGLHTASVIDQVTLRHFDQPCMPPIEPRQPAQSIACDPGGAHIRDALAQKRCFDLVA